MPVPTVYRTTGEQALASYDFIDIAEGTGIVNYFGLQASLSGARTNILSTNSALFSYGVQTSGAAVLSGTYFKLIDKDFDFQFNLPKIIKGNLIVSLTHAHACVSTSEASQHFINIRARKYDGTTETDLAVNSGAVLLSPAGGSATEGGTIEYQTESIVVPISRQNFKKGETFRLTVEAWAKANAGTGQTQISRFAHDPQNRDGEIEVFNTFVVGQSGAGTTKMNVLVPYIIDI